MALSKVGKNQVDQSASLTVDSDLTVDTNTLYVDSTNNRVGIGTSSPKTRLQSSAGGVLNAPSLGSSSTNAPLYLTNNDTAYGLVVGNNSADGHVWLQAQRTDGTATAYNITLNEAGGYVGIGTSPDAPLDVKKDNPSSGRVATFGSNGTPFTGIAAGLANAVTISRTLRTIAASTTTSLVFGYGGSIVLITLVADTGVADIQYTFLVTYGWNSASVLFTNSYGANTATFTFSASSGNLQVNHNHTGAIKFNVAALVVPSPTAG